MRKKYYLLVVAVAIFFMGQSCDIPTDKTPEAESIPTVSDSVEELPTSIENKIDLIENIDEASQEMEDDNSDEAPIQNLPTKTEDLPVQQGNTVINGQTCSHYEASVKQNWQCEKTQWCGTSLNVCHDEPYCLEHSDCSSGICTGGYCLGGSNPALPEHSPCKNNAQCISGKLCVNGGCVPAEEVLLPDEIQENAPCSNNAQCISGKLCQDGSCVPAEDVLFPDGPQENSPCSNDNQCIDGKVCQNNECIIAS